MVPINERNMCPSRKLAVRSRQTARAQSTILRGGELGKHGSPPLLIFQSMAPQRWLEELYSTDEGRKAMEQERLLLEPLFDRS